MSIERPIRSRRRAGECGFTMIELVMVIIAVAVLAAAAAPFLFRASTTISAGAFADKVRSDVRYAQSLAMNRSGLDTPAASSPSFRYRIRFNVADASCPYTSQYTIVSDSDNNGTWGENPNGAGDVESARNPAGGDEFFCVQMDSGDFEGIAVAADFGGSQAGVLEFDTSGVPYDSNGTRIAASKTITVTKGGESTALTLTPNTGYVHD